MSTPRRKIYPERGKKRVEVTAPRDGDGDVSDSVLEDKVPAYDPGDHLAERRIRIGVRAPCLWNHRRQLGVAERGKSANESEKDERSDERRARAVAHDDAGWEDLA